MKKLLLSLVALMAFGASAMADEIKVSPVDLRQGGTGVMTIELVNPDGHHYRAFQFDITLPEGITIESASKGAIITAPDGKYMLDFNNRGVSEGNRYGFAYTDFDDTYAITEGGIVLEIVLKADESLSIGNTYQAHFSGDSDVRPGGSDYIEFTYDAEGGGVGTLHPADFDVDITIVENIIILDENSTELPEIAENQKVLVKRTIKANEWGTICLPFDMTAEEVATIFGSDAEFAEFESYEVDGGEVSPSATPSTNATNICVNFYKTEFDDEFGFMANNPYLIKTTKDISEFTVASVNVDPNDDIDIEYSTGSGSRKKIYGHFYGTMLAGQTIPANGLFLSGGNFWYSTGATVIKGFRGYFVLNDVLADLSSGVKMQVNVDGEPTRVNNLQIVNTNGAAYTIDGKKINNTDNLPKGVYIIDGKKVAIK